MPSSPEVRPRSALLALCLSITHTHPGNPVPPGHSAPHPRPPPVTHTHTLASLPLLPRIGANSSSFMFGPFTLPPNAPQSSTSPGRYAEPYFKLIPPVLSINTFISPSSRLPFAPRLSPLQQILDQAHYLRCPLYTVRDPSRPGHARGICLSGTGRETLWQIWCLDAHGRLGQAMTRKRLWTIL